MTSSPSLSDQTFSTPGVWPGAQTANLSTPVSPGSQGAWTATSQAQTSPEAGRTVGDVDLGSQSPEPSAMTDDSLEHAPLDGWMLWVLFLLVLLGVLSVALLIGF